MTAVTVVLPTASWNVRCTHTPPKWGHVVRRGTHQYTESRLLLLYGVAWRKDGAGPYGDVGKSAACWQVVRVLSSREEMDELLQLLEDGSLAPQEAVSWVAPGGVCGEIVTMGGGRARGSRR